VAHESSQTVTAEPDFFADPAWFPEGFEPGTGEFKFVSADRAELAAQTFLDERWDRAKANHARAKTAGLIARLGAHRPQPRFIWHTGFCCSTLLAKAFENPGRNLSLCEPQILVDIAGATRAGVLAADGVPGTAHLAFHLLARGFAPGEVVTIKPSPAANPLARLAATSTSGPMLFLFSDCRSFVISIFKLGEAGRKYVRRLFLILLRDGHAQQNWPAARTLSLSDLELAAVLWHMQIAEFARARSRIPNGRAAALDCDALLAAPAEALCEVDRFFGLGLGRDRLQNVAVGPLFHRNAKTPGQTFDADRRREEHGRIARALGSDLDHIVAQSYAICGTTPRGAPLPDLLLPIEKTYCP
jgi:hypothetical protein